MFNYLEKLFPELLIRARRLPVAAKMALLLGIVFVPPALGYLLSGGRQPLQVLSAEIRLPLWLILVGSVLVSVVIAGAMWGMRASSRRSILKTFFLEWHAYRSHLELFYLHIEQYLRLSSAERAETGWAPVQEMLHEYYHRRSILRELLHRLGEEQLLVRSNPRWEALKRSTRECADGGYLSPFSFLVDLDQPIYAVNHYGKQIWEAMFISDEYVEYLTYQYRFLKPWLPKPAQESV